MLKKLFALLLLFLLATPLAFSERPNVVLIFTDDHGYADLGCMGLVDDVETPHLDRLAAEGVCFTNGYITAPQCCPSRAGLMTGRYQQKFGFESNGKGPLPLKEKTIADRLSAVGYRTGMVGKWHLEPNISDDVWMNTQYQKLKLGPLPPAKRPRGAKLGKIPLRVRNQYLPFHRGFQDTNFGEMYRIWQTYDLNGERFDQPQVNILDGDRLDHQTRAATTFIDQNKNNPFFLYLAYFAPHVPLEATEKYLGRFTGEMPERRRYALAMISAIDDGVGRILDKLAEHEIDENTLIFFISDNGAPLKIEKKDLPLSMKGGAWNGSLNTPLNGEKGMLSEGGIRVPFLARWKGTIPAGQVYEHPVISLDASATILSVAKAEVPSNLDGVDILPHLTGQNAAPPHDALYWKFWNQWAIRKGAWKYLIGNQREFLFNLDDDLSEQTNLIAKHPEKAKALQEELLEWNLTLHHKANPLNPPASNSEEVGWYDYYFPLSSQERQWHGGQAR